MSIFVATSLAIHRRPRLYYAVNWKTLKVAQKCNAILLMKKLNDKLSKQELILVSELFQTNLDNRSNPIF